MIYQQELKSIRWTMCVLTLQWASAKEVKCLASSSVNSGSISSHRTAKPLQPSCWSCLKRRACILYVQLIEKGVQKVLTVYFWILYRYVNTWSWLQEDLAPLIHNIACLAQVIFRSRKSLPDETKWSNINWMVALPQVWISNNHLLVSGIHQLLQLVALFRGVKLSPTSSVFTVVLWAWVKYGAGNVQISWHGVCGDLRCIQVAI